MSSPSAAKPCNCTLCDEEFTSITKMEAHRKTCTLVCPDCGQIFKKRASYAKHMDVSSCQTNKIPCQICQVKFKTDVQLAAHLRDAYEDAAPWKCAECPMKFARLDVFKRHVTEMHQGIKRKAEMDCKCPCGYVSNRKLNWDRHVKVCPAHRIGAADFLHKAFANSTAGSAVDKALDALHKTVEAARQAMVKHQPKA